MREQRIKDMINYIHSTGTVSLDELCEHFNISKNTVRRDINTIVDMGEVKKVYGGVVSLSSEVLPFENRSIAYNSQKEEIAKKAAEYIEDNDLLFIDSGTTTCFIPKYIDPNKTITIITNSLSVINETLDKENFEVILIGTRLKRKTKSFVNVEDWSYFDRMNINKAFLAATGISFEKGVTNSDILEYEIKRRVVQKASKNHLLVDHSKFGKAALLTYCSISDLDVIITDDSITQELKSSFQKNKAELLTTNAVKTYN